MKKYFLALLLFLPLFASVSAYADTQDVTYNLSSSNVEAVVCRNNDANLPACSDYQFLKIDVTGTFLVNQNINVSPNGVARSYMPTSTIIDLSNMFNITQLYVGASILSNTDNTIVLTLTNLNSCPEPEPCPSCPDCSDASKFIQVVIDAFWKFVIAFAGVVTSIIVIMLVFRLIRKVF